MAKKERYAKLHTKMLASTFTGSMSAAERGVFCWLLARAKEGKDTGEVVYSSWSHAAIDLKVDRKTLHRIITAWEIEGSLKYRETRGCLEIFLVKYAEYQAGDYDPTVQLSWESTTPNPSELGFHHANSSHPPKKEGDKWGVVGNSPREIPASLLLIDRARKKTEQNRTEHSLECVRNLFIEYCKTLPAPDPVEKWSQARRRSVLARAEEHAKDPDFWMWYFRKVAGSLFLTGKEKNFRATFDWLMKPANMTKVLEGNYDNQRSDPNEVVYTEKTKPTCSVCGARTSQITTTKYDEETQSLKTVPPICWNCEAKEAG